MIIYPAAAVKNTGHNSQYQKKKKEPQAEFEPVLRQEMKGDVPDVEMSPDVSRVIMAIKDSKLDGNLIHEAVAMLEELKTLRSVQVRPATKYLSNSLPMQMDKIQEELHEVVEAVEKFLDGQRPFGSFFDLKHDAMQEFMDLQGACETAIHIMEPNREARIREKIQHFMKDDIRGYYN